MLFFGETDLCENAICLTLGCPRRPHRADPDRPLATITFPFFRSDFRFPSINSAVKVNGKEDPAAMPAQIQKEPTET